MYLPPTTLADGVDLYSKQLGRELLQLLSHKRGRLLRTLYRSLHASYCTWELPSLALDLPPIRSVMVVMVMAMVAMVMAVVTMVTGPVTEAVAFLDDDDLLAPTSAKVLDDDLLAPTSAKLFYDDGMLVMAVVTMVLRSMVIVLVMLRSIMAVMLVFARAHAHLADDVCNEVQAEATRMLLSL